MTRQRDSRWPPLNTCSLGRCHLQYCILEMGWWFYRRCTWGWPWKSIMQMSPSDFSKCLRHVMMIMSNSAWNEFGTSSQSRNLMLGKIWIQACKKVEELLTKTMMQKLYYLTLPSPPQSDSVTYIRPPTATALHCTYLVLLVMNCDHHHGSLQASLWHCHGSMRTHKHTHHCGCQPHLISSICSRLAGKRRIVLSVGIQLLRRTLQSMYEHSWAAHRLIKEGRRMHLLLHLIPPAHSSMQDYDTPSPLGRGLGLGSQLLILSHS